MADSIVAGVPGTFEFLLGRVETKAVVGSASYYLVSTLIFFAIIQFLNNQRRLMTLLGLERRQRKSSGNNNTLKGDNGDDRPPGLEVLPGPGRGLPIIGAGLELLPLSKTFKKVKEWSDRYGPIIKFDAPFHEPVVILNSAPLIQTLMKSTDLGHVVKMPLVYDLMRPFITNGVLVSKGKFWQHERKILLRSMSFQSLRAYIPMLNNHCQRFVSALNKLFQDGGVHPINAPINCAFLEVMCEMITGYDIHNTSEGVEYHHNFQIWKETMAHRIAYPWNIPGPLFKLNPLSKKNDKAVQGLFDFAKRRIAEHRAVRADAAAKQEVKSHANFRSVLDELVDAGVTDDQIVDEVNTMLFGGHETGASTIHFFCLSMSLNPEIQEQCKKEVDDVFEDPMLLQDGRLTFESLSNLKYLERCILETLRLYPPVFAFLRQLQSPLRIELDNQPVELPKGTNTVIYPFGLHRMEEYYPEPEKFDPERFLPEVMAQRPAYSYMPFSGGSRNCLGLKFAMIEMKTVAAYLLRNFHMQTTDRLEDVPLLPNLTLTPERDYNFIFQRRVHNK